MLLSGRSTHFVDMLSLQKRTLLARFVGPLQGVLDASIFVKGYLSAGSVTTYLEAVAVFGLVTPSLVSPSEHEGLQVSFAMWRPHAFDSAKG